MDAFYDKSQTQRDQAERRRQAQEASDRAVADLKAALTRAELALGSLRSSEPVDGRGFVDLGGTSSEIVSRLAKVINAGVDALQAAGK